MSARRLIFRAVCLAGILGLGIQVVYAVVIFWVASVGSQLVPSSRPSEYLTILADGTPVIVTYSPTEYQSQTARTLEGEPVARKALDLQASGSRLAGAQTPRTAGQGWSARIRAFRDGREPPIYWYFVHTGKKEGYGYFVGYDSKLKLRVGYIGAGGFRPDKPPPDECFPVDGRKISPGSHTASPAQYLYYNLYPQQPSYLPGDSPLEPIRGWMVYLVSKDRILEIDLEGRSVRTVFQSDQIVSLDLSERLFPIPEAEEPVRELHRCRYLAVRLKDRVLVIDPHGTERRNYMLPEQIREKPFTFYERSDATAILEVRPRPGRSPVNLYWIGDAKAVVRSETLALEEVPQIVLLRLRTVYLTGPRGIDDPRIVSGLFALVSPVPAVWGVASTVALPADKLRSGEAHSYPAALTRSFGEVWPGVLISLVLSAGAVWMCLRRQRQYALPWTRTWAVLVFIFGIPGLLGYLLHRRWPVREECPACGEEAPRDREACFACGSEFPEPAPKGIEVFA